MRRQFALASIVVALALPACNAGSSNLVSTTTMSNVTQSVPITGQAANAAFPVSLSTAVSQAAGISTTSFTLPVTLPANTVVTANTAQPADITTPFSSAHRALASFRSSQATSIPDATARLFFDFTTPSAVSIGGDYSFSFTLTSTPLSDANYYISLFDGQQWRANATGSAATISGNTVTFTGTFPAGLAVSANTHYGFALYTLPKTTTGSVTTSTSGTPGTIGGLIDGSVTLTMPLSTSPAVITYTSTQVAPTNGPNLATVSGISDVPGYIIITPQTNVTFAAGQVVKLSHPYSPNNSNGSDQGSNNSGTPSGTSNGTAPGTSAGSDNSNSNSNSNSTPLIAIYNAASSSWVLGNGVYANDGTTESLTTTLTSAITLTAGTTYYFGVYNT